MRSRHTGILWMVMLAFSSGLFTLEMNNGQPTFGAVIDAACVVTFGFAAFQDLTGSRP